MKIIFSRKGFDSAAGGVPSPIGAGRPISLPIPTKMPSPLRFRDLTGEIPKLIADLTGGKVTADRTCHLDPDIDHAQRPRKAGWRGALGQDGAGYWPWNNESDEARLMYVAMTRAVDDLVITSSKKSVFAERLKALCEPMAA